MTAKNGRGNQLKPSPHEKGPTTALSSASPACHHADLGK